MLMGELGTPQQIAEDTKCHIIVRSIETAHKADEENSYKRIFEIISLAHWPYYSQLLY